MQPTEIEHPVPDPAELPPGPEDLARRLRSVKNLPTPPAVAMQVLELTRDDNCRMDQLVTVLQSDPVLTAQLMRLANSSLFPGKSEVTSVGQASMKLGFRQLRTMSLSMSLLDEAEGGSRNQFPIDLYQRYSLCWSIGAQTTGERMGLEASELFLGGLLAPMGHMILAACYPELYGRLLVEARGELPLEEREYALLGSDSPLACAMLLESWELPHSICESLRNLSGVPAENWPESTQAAAAPPTAAKGDVRDALNFGRLLARTLVSRRPSRYLRELEELASERYQLAGAALDDYLFSLEPLFKERAELLNITGVETGWVAESLERARAEIQFEDSEPEQKPDALTGLASAETFRARLERQLMERRMHGGDPLSLGLIHLELGPKVELGTRSGEAWLRWSGAYLHEHLREPNDAAHMGDGVFAILVPRASARMLRNFSERLVSGLEAAREQIPENLRGHLRLSVGAACAEDLSQDPKGQQLWGSTAHLLERARTSEGPRRIVCVEIPKRAA